jgi:prepilin-type N-terminal cleavage/methylation domain-containing protein
MRRFSTKGFTMIELLIVIAIIGVLATIGLGAAFGQSRRAAKDAKMKSHLSALQIAMESYYADFKEYPSVTTIEAVANELASTDYITTQTALTIAQDLPGHLTLPYKPRYIITSPYKEYQMIIELQVDNADFIVEGQ